MKNILMIIVAAFVVVVMTGFVTAAAPMAMVSGEVKDASNNLVSDANVVVICTHNGTDTTNNVVTNLAGKYYAFFGSTECSVGDSVLVQTVGSEDKTGFVSYNSECKIDTLKLDLQIPEFGVIGGAIVLLAGLGIVAYRRK